VAVVLIVAVLVVAGVVVFRRSTGPSSTTTPPSTGPSSTATPPSTGPSSTTTPPSTGPGTSSPAGSGAAGLQPDQMQLAATLTHSTALSEALPQGLLDRSVRFVGVTMYGDGDPDPEPEPGTYDWSGLDARMQQVAGLDAAPVLKVFNAPGWMKFADRPKSAVTPAHYQDFADLAVAVARRYPQIHYFEIWNELWGYRQGLSGPWNYQAYTDFYNVVYQALKAYNPNLQVGGPYVPFPPATEANYSSALRGPWGAVDQRSLDAVSYWLQHKAGADFIVVDGRTGPPTQVPPQPAAATEMFAAVDQWLRSQTGLPIWWNEWYAESAQLGPAEWNAVSADALLQLASSGASMANLYQAEYVSNLTAYPQLVRRHGIAPTPGLWMHGTDASTPLAQVFETMQDSLSGTAVRLYQPTPGVEVLASAAHYVAVDVDGSSHLLVIEGKTLTIGPWQILSG
jgi:hypothetical protein